MHPSFFVSLAKLSTTSHHRTTVRKTTTFSFVKRNNLQKLTKKDNFFENFSEKGIANFRYIYYNIQCKWGIVDNCGEKLLTISRKAVRNMRGEYSHAIDGKGRLFIPAKFREKLGTTFVVTRGVGQYLSVYPMDEWEAFEEKIRSLKSKQALELQRYFVAPAQDSMPDGQGRVLLSQKLRAHAKLDKNVLVAGMGNHLEIWDEETWDSMNPSAEQIESIMEEAGI